MIHVERYGTGAETYVCVHGWGGNHLTYAPLAPFVPGTVSLYAVDLPGYGRSPHPPEWSLETIGRSIAGVLDRIDAPSLTMVGNCSGAVLALVAAELAPARVHRVVLIDAFAFTPWYFKIFVHPVAGEVAYRSTFANPLGRWLTNLSLRHRRTAETDLTGSFRDIDPGVSLRYLRLLDAIPDVRRFGAITVPVDLLHGAHTFTAVKDSLQVWQRLWPEARTWRIEGAGHLPLEEMPAAVAAILFAADS